MWEAVPALSGETCSAVDGRWEDVAILILVPPAVCDPHCVPVSIIQDPNKSWDLLSLSHTPGPNVAGGEVRDVT